jgi:predicted AlkP superfamily pyrophosphatase or phosphodiesterase
MKLPKTVLIMIDGLRPDAVTAERCPALNGLRARGAWTFRARSVMPSITLPCHTSIFHSVPPTRHGVTTNDWSPMARPLPGLVDVARAANRRGLFLYNWEPLRNLSQPGSLYESRFRDTSYDLDGDQWVADSAVQALTASERPDFTFVYLGTVDTSGHMFGWMSEGYLAQAAKVDEMLGKILAAVPDDTVVLVHSDHGGHDRTHGNDIPEDMTIPWVIAGPGIRRDREITSPVSLLDTTPTLARVLDIEPHPQWEGRWVEDVFEA